MLHVRIIKPSQMWGGDSEIDSEAVVDSILDRDAETQSAEDQDWDSTDTETGDQAKSKTSEGEEGEAESDQGDAADESEEDSGEESEESTEDSDDEFQLPAKQAKSYDDKVLTHYAKRIGSTLEAVKGNPPLMKAVKTMIDNDIYIEQQKALSAEEDVTDESTEEDSKTQEQPKEVQLTPEEKEQQFQEYRANLSKFVKNPKLNDPRMISAYKTEQAKAWGIDLSKPGAEAALKAKGIDLDAMVESQIAFMANALNTYLPQFLPQILPGAQEQSFPGFQKMYDNALQSNIWDELAGTKDLAGVPAYGTPEFNTKLADVLKANPWIEKVKFEDSKGRVLDRQGQLREKYRVAAGFMVGKKPDPAVVAKAVEAGRREQRKVDVKKKAASNLGAGNKGGNFSDGKNKMKGSGLGIVEEYESRNRGF
jgi:hypothetical protein